MFLNLVRSPSALLATLSQAPSGQPPLDPSLAPPPSNPVSYPLLPTRAHSLSVTVQLILFAPPRFDRTDCLPRRDEEGVHVVPEADGHHRQGRRGSQREEVHRPRTWRLWRPVLLGPSSSPFSPYLPVSVVPFCSSVCAFRCRCRMCTPSNSCPLPLKPWRFESNGSYRSLLSDETRDSGRAHLRPLRSHAVRVCNHLIPPPPIPKPRAHRP